MIKISKLVGRLTEGSLKLSSAVTSIVILLIVIFLFKEGFGLFSSSTVTKGYALYVNSENTVANLAPYKIKKIFDGEIQNWSVVGGKNQKIEIFRFEQIFSLYSEAELGKNYRSLPQKLNQVVAENEAIIAYFPKEYMTEASSEVRELPVRNINLTDFFLGKKWLPTASPSPLFGILPLITGTLLVSLLAILIALPLGIGVSIYLSELAGSRMRKLVKPMIELLAGIPSVVYGFFGLVVLVPLVQDFGGLEVGQTAFTGGVILAIMALPTIISVSEDAMRNTPDDMRQASYALGATKWQTIYKVVIPYASSGISAAIVLGIGRAIGETMAVLMVTGNAAIIPHSIFESVRTIPATIAAELGEAPVGGAHYQSLFMLGCVLFLITLVISVSAEIISNRKKMKR